MGEQKPTPDWNFTERDRIILSELAEDPDLSARELRDILEEKHGVNISRVTVSESIRKMREAGVFREAIIPNEEYLFFSLFEYKFHPPNFRDNWQSAMETIRNDEHTFIYFLSDGEYKWKSIMMFKNREQESKWIHEFYEEHGELLDDLRNSVVTNVLKFNTDPKVLKTLLKD